MQGLDDKEDELIEFADRATKLLQFNLINDAKLQQLRDIVNPSHYMKPYDADKVNLANELFSRLNVSPLLYSEFRDIEMKAYELQK